MPSNIHKLNQIRGMFNHEFYLEHTQDQIARKFGVSLHCLRDFFRANNISYQKRRRVAIRSECYRLLQNERMTVPQIAEKLQLDVRTVRSYLKKSKIRFARGGDRSRSGYFRKMKKLNPQLEGATNGQ